MKKNITILLLLTFILIIIDFSLGSVSIPFQNVFDFLTFSINSDNEYFKILHQIRLPRVLSAITSGICLSLTGLLMQNYFRNPLAGPYVLGISSGAGLGVALFIMANHIISTHLPTWFIHTGISGSAIAGALFFLFIIYLISLRLQQTLTLLIAGILLGTAANAIVSFLENISNGFQIQSFVYWSMGSLNNSTTYSNLIVLSIALISLVILLYYSSWFDLWLLGDEQAVTSGLSKKFFSFIVFSITAILVGLCTAFFGPIAFVGLISPHIARMIFKTQIHKCLLIYTLFVGMNFMLIADIFMQLLIFSNMPLNTIISLLALPILTYLFVKKKELWM